MNRWIMGTLTAALITGNVLPGEKNDPQTDSAITQDMTDSANLVTAQMAEVLLTEGAEVEPAAAEEPEPTIPLLTEEPEPTIPPITEEPEPTVPPITEEPEPTVPPITEEPEPTVPPITEEPEPTIPPITEEPEPTVPPITDTPVPEPTQAPVPTVSPVPVTPAPEEPETPSPVVRVSIKTDPEDATVLVLDSNGDPVEEKNGLYSFNQGETYEVYARKEGYQELHQKIVADSAGTEYHLKLLSSDNALKGLYISSSDTYGKGILKLSPELEKEKDRYNASYDGERESLNIWPEAEDSAASIKVYAISGIKPSSIEKDETIAAAKDKKKRLYWKIFFADQEKEAKVRIEITAEDGTQRDIYVTMTLKDTTAPVLKKISASRISTETASAVYKTSEKGTCYYQVIEAGGEVPVLDTSAGGTEILAGTNTIRLDGLTAGEKDLVIVVKDEAGNISEPLVMRIPDIKNNSMSNLVHGSDHSGNKSQATLPGTSGEGSLSNLKQVEGTKVNKNGSVSNAASTSLLAKAQQKQLLKEGGQKEKKVPAWTIKEHVKSVLELLPGYTVAGKKSPQVKESLTDSMVSNEEKTSEKQIPVPTHADSEQKTTTFTANTGKQKTTFASAAGTLTRNWKKASLPTKILVLFAGIGMGFLIFWTGARRRFRKQFNRS